MDIASIWLFLLILILCLIFAGSIYFTRLKKSSGLSVPTSSVSHKSEHQNKEPEKRHSLLSRSKVIAVYNIKGGVGKTSSAVNVAYKLSGLGHKTLLWDMDPQGATSFYLRCEKGISGGLQHIVEEMKLEKEQRKIFDNVHSTEYENLFVLPADNSFWDLDIEVAGAKLSNQFIKQMLSPFREAFDFIIVDCPPGLTASVESLLNMSDQIVSPVVPTPLSVRMFDELKVFLSEHVPSKPKFLGFFSMVDTRKALHKDLMVKLLQENPRMVFPIIIPYSAEVERMGVEKAPLSIFAKDVMADKAFDKLIEKVVS